MDSFGQFWLLASYPLICKRMLAGISFHQFICDFEINSEGNHNLLEDPAECLCAWIFFSVFTDKALPLVMEKRSKSVSSLLTSLAWEQWERMYTIMKQNMAFSECSSHYPKYPPQKTAHPGQESGPRPHGTAHWASRPAHPGGAAGAAGRELGYSSELGVETTCSHSFHWMDGPDVHLQPWPLPKLQVHLATYVVDISPLDALPLQAWLFFSCSIYFF